MKQLLIAETNEYLQKSAAAAQAFLRKDDQQKWRKAKNLNFQRKYANVFQAKAGHNVVFILATIGHIGAVLWEGSLIQPLCEEWLGDFVHPSMQLFVALLPVLILFSFSIAVGHQLQKISFERHDLESNKFRYDPLKHVARCSFMVVLYISFLYHLMLVADEMLEESLKINEFIILLGIVELVLSYFAIIGWEIIFVHTRQRFMRIQYKWGQKKMEFHLKSCLNNYRYFHQRLRQVDEVNRTIFLRQADNKRIKQTIMLYTDKYDKKTA